MGFPCLTPMDVWYEVIVVLLGVGLQMDAHWMVVAEQFRIDGMHMVVASWVPAFVGCSCSVVGWSTLWCS